MGKAFARVLLIILQKLASRVYPESQCGFRAGRCTVGIIFSVRQLQTNCREQGMSLYVAFIDLNKAFDLVRRKGLFRLLEKIGCPPKLRSMVVSFHENMKGTVVYDGSSLERFPVCSGVKQGCVLAPTLFGIFFSLLLSYAFDSSSDGIDLHTRSDGKLFNLAHLRAKTKVTDVYVREMLFVDDATLTAHSGEALQRLVNRFAHACREFEPTISLKKTNIIARDASQVPSVKINDYTLEVVEDLTYLGSNISNNVSLDTEINRRIGKAVCTIAKLTKRVWENKMLSENTKMRIYQAYVLSTLLYCSESWTTYMCQERRLNTFHMRCLKRILGIIWQDRIPYSDILDRDRIRSMYLLLSQRRLRWLEDGRLPKDILYGQLTSGARPVGRPALRFKDACNRDMKACDINPKGWEAVAEDRTAWRQATRRGIERADENKNQHAAEKRMRRKQKAALPPLSSWFVRFGYSGRCFTATVDAAKIVQVDNGAHQNRRFETTLCLL